MHVLYVCVVIVLTHEFEYLTIIHTWCDVTHSAQICKVWVVVTSASLLHFLTFPLDIIRVLIVYLV